MDDAGLERVRAHLGTVLATMSARIGALADAGPDWWLGLTGGVSADLNMAFLATSDPDTLAGTVAIVEEAGLDALVMLAGPGRELSPRLTAPWVGVGTSPIMTRDLTTGGADALDPRVRQAGAADAGVLAALIAEAFALPVDDAALMAAAAVTGGVVRAWLLEEGGEVVSAVVTGHLDDGVSLWAMSTPSRLARRGFGRTLLASVLAHARADGATLGMLGATPAGLPLYEATGWRTVEEWEVFTNAESAQFSH
ncbi:GNAT family N-acetyltransferase [Nocardioides conyzicola]|uniref:N-acetyltransferase domain-containing protein n=1 Tax=Nocardioides conyzicola TaxID=1651781 RepID=A0ABP8XLX2_9ACTN